MTELVLIVGLASMWVIGYTTGRSAGWVARDKRDDDKEACRG